MIKKENPGKHLAVDEPIINSPFEEPTNYWVYDTATGMPAKATGRRDAHYYFRSRRRHDQGQTQMWAEEEMVPLGQTNQIRNKVRQWREGGYKNASQITKQLLRHWTSDSRERRLFFCQLEAVETIIWLNEIHRPGQHGITVTKDSPHEEEFKDLTRYCVKMATGSGKTLVMAMIAAWSVLNKVTNKQARFCSDCILIVCPNLTVKERLGGVVKNNNGSSESDRALIPGAKGNYYEKFDMVPDYLFEYLGRGKFIITNWHLFAEIDDNKSKGILKRGKESPRAFANRVLKGFGSAKNIIVFNDEAHHAYRPAPADADESITAAQKKEKEQATVWVSGLDRLNLARNINYVVDLSATPFYLQGSGFPEGSPFEWIVSDFGLVDAIECGIVKIPQVPVDSNSGRPIPEYFTLWKWIKDKLPAQARKKPESILREADAALKQLASQWKEKISEFEESGYEVPPVLIIVCNNTSLAQLAYEYISGERIEVFENKKGKKVKQVVYDQGNVFPELLSNSSDQEFTIRIDSKLLKDDISSEDDLRRKVATVGKVGELGQDVRCVVSVSMLTEGWDAQNVTQILGLRAFESQLLCEQVVGRGLRRTQYDDFTIPEYVDVYGIPFEVIPVKKKAIGPAPTPPPSTLVQSLSDREHLMIEFPRVEGYVFKVESKIIADIDNIEEMVLDTETEPTETIVTPRIGYQVGNLSQHAPGERLTHTRQEFYDSVRPQQIFFEITKEVTSKLLDTDDFKQNARQLLFPQVLNIVRQYCKPKSLGGRIKYNNVDHRELGLLRYTERVVERLSSAIRPDTDSGEPPILPRFERFKPKGSTKDILFRTSKKTKGTIKSHISHVVLDSKWEGSAAYHIEQLDQVVSYVKNDRLDFSIQYEFDGNTHYYVPDFILKLRNGLTLVLEIKGKEDEKTRSKHESAKRWCNAVSNWNKMGKWCFDVCRDPNIVASIIKKY